MAKVKYYAKEKTMVSTNRPKVLAFASDIVERELTVLCRAGSCLASGFCRLPNGTLTFNEVCEEACI